MQNSINFNISNINLYRVTTRHYADKYLINLIHGINSIRLFKQLHFIILVQVRGKHRPIFSVIIKYVYISYIIIFIYYTIKT